MSVLVERIAATELERYAAISPAYRVESVLQLTPVGGVLGGFLLREEPVLKPYEKDNDGYEGGPLAWRARFDVNEWGFVLALDAGQPVGAAAVAPTSPRVSPLQWADSATLVDIRVRADRRAGGIGSRLLDAAATCAREQQGARSLLIETQNVNVAACRFYAARGAELAAIDRFAYAGTPDLAAEVMLVWRLPL